MEAFLVQFSRHGRKLLVLVAAIVHLAFILLVTVRMKTGSLAETESADVFKMADIAEYIAPPPERKEFLPKDEVVTVRIQDTVATDVIETDKTIVENAGAPPVDYMEEPKYLPQYKISRIPVIPTEAILSRIQYPELAARQGIEGVVYLELYIDKTGIIRKIVVLKDPGYGFADAAVKAVQGSVCLPAAANDENVAVIFRYPVRFAIKR